MTTELDDRPFELLIYGATGYTGKKVAQYVVEKYGSDVTVAIAGRNRDKLLVLAKELNLSESNILVASLAQTTRDDDNNTTANENDNDNGDDALVSILAQSKIVLACAGPYRHCGMPIAKAAVKAGTDYLDLCGEPQFFDDILVECEDDARRENVLVLSACAFDCVPAELSSCLVSRELSKRYGPSCDVAGIEVCHTFQGITKANATTFHAAVDGFHAAASGELKTSRKRVKDTFDIQKPPPRPDNWPKLPKQPGTLPTYHEETNTYTLKFPGADAAAILSSWRYLRLRQPDQYKDIPSPRLSVCVSLPTQMDGFKLLSYGAIFASLAQFSSGCQLLHNNPSLFSNGIFPNADQDPPTDDELKEASFCTYTTAYGSTEPEVVRATCRGPEPGYIATPRMMVALAMTLLHHRSKLPFTGGVMTPGALFGNLSEVYEELKEHSIVFEIVESNSDET